MFKDDLNLFKVKSSSKMEQCYEIVVYGPLSDRNLSKLTNYRGKTSKYLQE